MATDGNQLNALKQAGYSMLMTVEFLRKVCTDSSVSNHVRDECMKNTVDLSVSLGILTGAFGTGAVPSDMTSGDHDPNKDQDTKEAFGFKCFTKEAISKK